MSMKKWIAIGSGVVVFLAGAAALTFGGGGGGDSGTSLRQKRSTAAIERCKEIARGQTDGPVSQETIADCAALLEGSPLELNSLLNQAAAIESLGTTSAPTTTATTTLTLVRHRATSSTQGKQSTTTSAPPGEEATTTSTDPPCTAPLAALCGVEPIFDPDPPRSRLTTTTAGNGL